jgi:outer membrane autotransporter protein
VINSGTIGRVDIPDNLIDLAGINANSGGLVVTNNNGALIQGSIAIQGNVTATITNSGTISGIVGGGGQAINVAGGLVTVTNNATGLITADAYAINADTANVTNYGTISAPAPGGGGTAINASTSATVTNYASGVITSDASAISAPTISVINFGTISGTGLGANGISGGLVVQVTNSGSITGGPGAAAISMSSGAITNNAGGTISGDQGIATFDATSIFNAGTITGTTGTAIQFVSGGNTLTLGPGFAINGNVLGAGADAFQLGGTGNGAFNLSLLGTQYTGFSTFNVIGGTWQATGTNANNWTISGGNLQVGPDASPNASITGTVTLTGGTLSGLGTVGNIVNTAGNVMPGGSIGVLHVTSNYTQAAGGALTIEVSPTAASQLKVGGAANLAGTLNLIFDPGIYRAGSYQIITAASVNGTFSTVTANDPLGVAHSILYNPTDVTLQLSVVSPTNDTIYTDLTSMLVMNGQQANSIILDRLGNRSSGIVDGEVALSGIGAPGPQYAQTGNAAVIGDLASALPQALAAQGAWFRGIGGFATVNGSLAAPGFTGTAGGFLAGFDRPVSETTYLGLAAGYLHSIVTETSLASGTAGTARLSVYGGQFVGPSLFTATAGYAHDWIDTSRILATGTGAESHGANEATVAGQWSLPLQVQGFSQGIATLTPKAGFQFLHLGENTFADTGAGGFDLSSASHSTDSFQPFVEVALAQKFVTADGALITPEVRLGYDREALAGSRTLTVATVSGAQFPVTGVKPSKNIATAGVGLAVQTGPALSLYATYDAILPTGNTTDHTVQAGLRLRF